MQGRGEGGDISVGTRDDFVGKWCHYRDGAGYIKVERTLYEHNVTVSSPTCPRERE